MFDFHRFSFSADQQPLALQQQNNCFLIDWLSVTLHGVTPEFVKALIGLDDASIPWEELEQFRNGYPRHYAWSGITISFGADEERFYSDPQKVRMDMGVMLNMSGTGCRTFETYGTGKWLRLFEYFFHDPIFDAERLHHRKVFRANVTRLDIAYDDHTGMLDMQQLLSDTQQRNFRCRAKYTERTISDDMMKDIQGTSLYFRSKKSPVLIRIYDKAAERGFKDQHWIRVEMQLRHERAQVFLALFLREQHLGRTVSGVLRNYLCFLKPVADRNISRWPLAAYWDKLLLDMDCISLWVTPGEEYNISRSEFFLWHQWGQVIRVLDLAYGSDYLIKSARELFPEDQLAPKYVRALESLRLMVDQPSHAAAADAAAEVAKAVFGSPASMQEALEHYQTAAVLDDKE